MDFFYVNSTKLKYYKCHYITESSKQVLATAVTLIRKQGETIVISALTHHFLSSWWHVTSDVYLGVELSFLKARHTCYDFHHALSNRLT